MNETHDVVIAGAGPVGLMLAGELRLAGVDVIVLERLAEPDLTIKAGSINVPTAQALGRRGLSPELAAAQEEGRRQMAKFFAGAAPRSGAAAPTMPKRQGVGAHFAGIMLWADNLDPEEPAFADLGPAADNRVLSQQDIEAILARWVGELGVPVRRGVEVRGFTDDGVGVTIDTGAGAIRASWLVGCDGGRSTVRKLAGFDFPGLGPEITGHQAVVEMTGHENVPVGWHDTPTGVYVLGPMPGRFLTVEFDGPPADRDTPITAIELENSLRAVTGADIRVSAVHSATRFTDNTRQVTEYRKGRVLLAGDAAHVHSPFGGQGLNLGIGDAVNLGWKLAAVVRGRAPEDLLDTYTRERHPIGQWVLEWTRAQIAVMRTDERSRAMRGVLTELLDSRSATTAIAKKLLGVLQRYDLGDDHPAVGKATPDFTLADGTYVSDHFAAGNAVLFDLADSPALRAAAAPWSDHVRVVTVKSVEARELSSLLVRPDGIVAWVSPDGRTDGLEAALERWFGRPAR
ncbi:FAD-dependent monooxygenase [Nocardia sp. NPDC088792]|uniref:FAD-dependent monooxygenase n=1 Tax=Nocardia sp. NPDC088792 TaxID=3364332 RepID=UPI0038142C0F